MNKLIKSIAHVFSSNLIAFLVNAAITFVLPKYIGITQYGYYQLFYFYSSYVGYLQFGWIDGLFLRLGGAYYEDIDKKEIKAQWRLFFMYAMIVFVLFWIGSTAFIKGRDYKIVAVFVGAEAFFVLLNTFFLYILQATGKTKEYSSAISIRSVVFLLGSIVPIIYGTNSYVIPCVALIIGQIIALVYLMHVNEVILTSSCVAVKQIFPIISGDIASGIKLTVSALSSAMIVGIVRLAIERCWSIETFGKVSLTLSVSNLLMVFIRAVALVMFPMLRRTNSDKLAGIYNTMRTCLMIPLLGMLVFYYPMKEILSAWLPAYADSLKYMALLFPMCVFESKTSMLIETYMKTLRKEKTLLFVNVATVCLSVLLTGVTVYGMHNLDLAIVSIVVLLAFRCVIAELLLSGSMEIQVKKDIALELGLTVIFICASWFIGGLSGLAIYAAAYLVYLFVKRHDVVTLLGFVKRRVLAKG